MLLTYSPERAFGESIDLDVTFKGESKWVRNYLVDAFCVVESRPAGPPVSY